MFVDVAVGEAGALQGFQVFGYGGLADVEGFGQFTDGCRTIAEACQYLATGGISERGKDRVQRFGWWIITNLFHNYMVIEKTIDVNGSRRPVYWIFNLLVLLNYSKGRSVFA